MNEKQKFMYSIFYKVLCAARRKKHVREHEHDFDAQEMYKKIVLHCIKSTTCRENATETLSYVNSAKLDSWKVT